MGARQTGNSTFLRKRFPASLHIDLLDFDAGAAAMGVARRRCYTRAMVEKLTAVAAVLGAVAAIVAAVGVLIVNSKLDRLTGRVDANTATITAHTNAPGLHR